MVNGLVKCLDRMFYKFVIFHPIMGIKEFSFSGSAAINYDKGLVPAMFKPWASRFLDELGSFENFTVLDLATGTGIVAKLLTEKVGKNGKVIGVDINGEMLSIAKTKAPSSEFIECPADSIKLEDGSVDYVVCQQGFQFFPDKMAAAKEINRVLKSGGKCAITTWMSIDRCLFFGAISSALNEIEEKELADKIRIPFDFMPKADLIDAFRSAEFEDIQYSEQEMELKVEDKNQAIDLAYATPIGSQLQELPKEKQENFKKILLEKVNEFNWSQNSLGPLVTSLVTAKKL